MVPREALVPIATCILIVLLVVAPQVSGAAFALLLGLLAFDTAHRVRETWRGGDPLTRLASLVMPIFAASVLSLFVFGERAAGLTFSLLAFAVLPLVVATVARNAYRAITGHSTGRRSDTERKDR